jgi:hypothetical protein
MRPLKFLQFSVGASLVVVLGFAVLEVIELRATRDALRRTTVANSELADKIERLEARVQGLHEVAGRIGQAQLAQQRTARVLDTRRGFLKQMSVLSGCSYHATVKIPAQRHDPEQLRGFAWFMSPGVSCPLPPGRPVKFSARLSSTSAAPASDHLFLQIWSLSDDTRIDREFERDGGPGYTGLVETEDDASGTVSVTLHSFVASYGLADARFDARCEVPDARTTCLVEISATISAE